MLSQKLENETGHRALPLSEVIEQLSKVRDPADAPELNLKRGGMLIVDEGAMLGSRRMFEVMQLCNRHKLSLRLIGDPKQIAASEPGSPMERLIEYVPPAVLQRVVRQKVAEDQEATLAMHKGKAKKALKSYAKRGHVEFLENAGEVTAKAAKDYADWRTANDEEGKVTAVLTLDSAAAQQVNALAREHLKASGYLGQGLQLETHYGTREFSTKDRIIIRERLDLETAAGKQRIYKGSIGTVLALNPGGLAVKLDGHEDPILLPLQKGMRIDHAHAIELTQPDPSESPQGSTLTSAFLAVTRQWSAPEAAVGISRHKKELTVYVNRGVYPDLKSLSKDASTRPERPSAIDLEDRRRPEFQSQPAAGPR